MFPVLGTWTEPKSPSPQLRRSSSILPWCCPQPATEPGSWEQGRAPGSGTPPEAVCQGSRAACTQAGSPSHGSSALEEPALEEHSRVGQQGRSWLPGLAWEAEAGLALMHPKAMGATAAPAHPTPFDGSGNCTQQGSRSPARTRLRHLLATTPPLWCPWAQRRRPGTLPKSPESISSPPPVHRALAEVHRGGHPFRVPA